MLHTNKYDMKIIEMIYCIQVNNRPFYFHRPCNCRQANYNVSNIFLQIQLCLGEIKTRQTLLKWIKCQKQHVVNKSLYSIIFVVQFIRSRLRYNLWRMLSKSLSKRCNVLQGLLLLEKLLLFMSKRILGPKLRILCW